MIGSSPSRRAATSNEARVRVESRSNTQATAGPFGVTGVQYAGPLRIASARSSRSVSWAAVRSAMRSRWRCFAVLASAVVLVPLYALCGDTGMGSSGDIGHEQLLQRGQLAVVGGGDEAVPQAPQLRGADRPAASLGEAAPGTGDQLAGV